MRVSVNLECSECRNRNYVGSKNRQKHPERLQVKKYCPHCLRHTIHRETK